MSEVSDSIPADAVPAALAGGAILVDVRDPNEWALGVPQAARTWPLSTLTEELPRSVADRATSLVFLCQSGKRSLRACDLARSLGYSRVASVDGGLPAWRAAGLPLRDDAALSAAEQERYSRHLLLPEFGVAGQRRLAASRVALIGAGGLGAPAALYLAAAGVGFLRVIDDDRIERSNLQRQVIHRDDGVGTPKAASAAAAMRALNPLLTIEPVEARVAGDNVTALIGDVDLVIDGSDNFPTRYLVNDACVRAGKPLVYGAVHRFEGQVSVFAAGTAHAAAPCYRCFFPEPPAPEDAPNCAAAGVLGVVPGIIGLLQANEAIKWLAGIGTPLIGRVLCFDALGARFRELRLARDPDCPGCSAVALAHPARALAIAGCVS
jgi:molybdopterin/thiamine biosynthesis adenylyltransferase/rhodanese-related sulfurtransferase